MKRYEDGFTLIEALIAFVVLTVGLLGASLFHSVLLKESASTKARSEAIKLAEKHIDGIRRAPTSTAYAQLVTTSYASSSIQGTNAIYSLNYIPTSKALSSLAQPIYEGVVTVSWNDSEAVSQSISLSSLFSWLDPAKALDVDEAGEKSTNTTGLNAVELPGGKANALERKVMPGVSGTTGSIVSQAVGTIIKYGVAVDNGNSDNVIQLVSVNSADDPIFRIDGVIADNPDAQITAADFDYISAAGGSSASVLDVISSVGSNCLIYEIVPEGSGGNQFDFGRYVCLMSEGWSGNISVVKNEAGATKTFEDENHFICYSSPRGYKYLIVDPENYDIAVFENSTVSAGSVGFTTVGASTIMSFSYTTASGSTSSATLSVNGQSGLVRFVDDSEDGYHWNDYFWHSPQLVASVGSPAWSKSGDVEQQNYFVSKKSGNKDTCEEFADVIASKIDTVSGFDFPASTSQDRFGVSQPFSDRNHDAGDVILAFAPERLNINGEILISRDTSIPQDPAEYVIVGNPQPVVSVYCDIDTTASVASGSYTSWSFDCAVPVRWNGALVAQPVNSSASPSICGESDDSEQLPDGVVDYYGRAVQQNKDDDVAYKVFEDLTTDIIAASGTVSFIFDPGTPLSGGTTWTCP